MPPANGMTIAREAQELCSKLVYGVLEEGGAAC